MPPETTSAPQTNARISAKYLRNSRPRRSRVTSACWPMNQSLSFRRRLLASLYHPVEAHDHGRRDRDAKLLRRAAIEYKSKPRDVLDRQIGRLRAGEKPAHILRRFASSIGKVGAVAGQRAPLHHHALEADDRHAD